MNVCVLSEQPRSCFAYNAESEPQNVSKPTIEQQDSFNIATLELWKDVGFKETQAVDDLYAAYKKRQKMEVMDIDVNKTDVLVSAKLEVEKATVELRELVELTQLLKSNQYITLQTCNRSEIQDRGYGLSLIQNLDVLRTNFHAAHSAFASGIEKTANVIQNRNTFASSLASLKKHWKLSFVDHRTGKRVPHFDPAKKHQIVVDCSLPSNSSSAIDTACHVPLRISEDGSLALNEDEVNRKHHTLVLTVETTNNDGTLSVASISSWDLKIQHEAKELNDTLVSDIHTHCVSRQHEAICRALFSRVQNECVNDADGWVVRNSIATADSPLHSLLYDKLESALTVRHVDHRSVILKVSESLRLDISLCPVVSITTAVVSTEYQWLSHALTCCLVNAQQCLQDMSSPESLSVVQTTARHIEDIRIAKNKASRTAATTMYARPLLHLLRAKISHHRVRRAMEVATSRCCSEWGLAADTLSVALRGSSSALSDGRRFVISLHNEVVLVVDFNNSSGALAMVSRCLSEDTSLPSHMEVVAPVLKELQSEREESAFMDATAALDTVEELQMWIERAVMIAHIRSMVKSAVKTGSFPVDLVSEGFFSFAIKPSGRHLEPSLLTLSVLIESMETAIIMKNVSQLTLFKSHLDSQSVVYSCVPLNHVVMFSPQEDVMDVENKEVVDADVVLRIEWQREYNGLDFFHKLLSILCVL